MSSVRIRRAAAADISAIAELLTRVKLPTDDLEMHLPHFWVAEQQGKVVGCVGMEVYPEGGLLRSLAVAPGLQKQGLGEQLYQAILKSAKEKKLPTIYLLTETAEEYFLQRGYRHTAREEVPESVKTSVEFQSVCPASAVCLFMKLGRNS